MIEYLQNIRNGKTFTLYNGVKMSYDRKTITQCQKENLKKENKECLFTGLCIHQSILEKNKVYCLKY